MWSNYRKTFCFRDCFDKNKVAGNVAGIQNMLKIEQFNKCHGVFIVSGALSTQIATDIEAYQTKDDGTWNITFFSYGKELCNISLWDYKEVQLCFEIEEEMETGKLVIYNCIVKAFKEYQL